MTDTHINHRAVSKRAPIKAADQMLKFISSTRSVGHHGIAKALRTIRILIEEFEDRLISIISQRKARLVRLLRPGNLEIALTVCAAPCHNSSVLTRTQSWICWSSASNLDAAVCATMPFRGSRKTFLVIAWRSRRRSTNSSKPQVFAIWEKLASSLTGNAFAMLKRVIACRLRGSSG